MKQKRGISIIVMVVTIIVMIIIAGAVILFLNSTNVIDIGEKSENEWNISTVKEQLTLLKSNKLLTNYSTEEVLYGRFSKYGVDIGNLEEKILIEDGNLVYDSINVTEEEAEYFESKGIQESKHYVIVSEETKNTKYADISNVGTYENFVVAVNAGEFNTSKDKDGNIVEAKYKIAYLEENIDFGNHELEDGTWVDKDGNAAVSIARINTFNGILDGQGHTLSGIYLSQNGYAAKQGMVDINNGVIKNITLNGYFSAKAILPRENNGKVLSCNIYGEAYQMSNWPLSGMCYTNNGTIYGCINYAKQDFNSNAGGIVYLNNKNGIIENCSNNSTRLDGALKLGGIVYQNYGLIYRSVNNAFVKSSNAVGCLGGIGVINEGTIKECVNNGIIGSWQNSGGIASSNSGEIINCYNTGNVDVTWYSAGICRTNEGTISNCYNIGSVGTMGPPYSLSNKNVKNSYSLKVSNILVDSNAVNCAFRTEEELKSDEQITLLNEGNTEEVWVKDTENINNGYPILKWQLEH